LSAGKAKIEGETIEVEWSNEEIKRTHAAFNLIVG
jgi:hypothetical protein